MLAIPPPVIEQGVSSPHLMKILHVLSQQPGRTGSGIFLECLIRQANTKKISQHTILGIPKDKTENIDILLPKNAIHPVLFNTAELPFEVTGMSDVMPYLSTKFSSFDSSRMDLYLAAFRKVLMQTLQDFKPDVLWTHHIWLVSALTAELSPNIPQITLCHGSELRQAHLAPKLLPYVVKRVSKINRFLALSKSQITDIEETFEVHASSIELTGGAIRSDVFNLARQLPQLPIKIVYAGKLSNSKGVPWLLQAYKTLKETKGLDIKLELVGGGEGEEAIKIRKQAQEIGANLHGVVSQLQLSNLLRRSHIFVLPSFFEGLPLVILEALACGCRIVATELTGLCETLPQKAFDSGIVQCVPLPRLINTDQPVKEDLPFFTARLTETLEKQIKNACNDNWEQKKAAHALVKNSTWEALFERILKISQQLIN